MSTVNPEALLPVLINSLGSQELALKVFQAFEEATKKQIEPTINSDFSPLEVKLENSSVIEEG